MMGFLFRTAAALALGVAFSTMPARAQQADVPPRQSTDNAATADAPFAVGGSIDAGVLHDALSAGFPAWNGRFVRGLVHTSPTNTVSAEANDLREFGGHGSLFVLGDTVDLDQDWYVAAVAQAGAAGFFLPRKRFDLDVHRKLLADRSLVVSLGASAIDARDVHRDRAIKLSAAYYLASAWVLEGGATLNRSNPGDVRAPSGFFAVTQGQAKEHFLSIRYGTGREAYQIVGAGATLSDFISRTTTFTWRQWFTQNWGMQLRGENYRNPTYHRNGGEVGVFHDF